MAGPGRHILALAGIVLVAGVTEPAAGRIFGTPPLPISTSGSRGPNGPSAGAAVSGDNRKTRLAAFHSNASNLVRGDTNGVTDVFVWFRPHGSKGLRLNRPMGSLVRASVSNGGRQANGPSMNPSLDGSLRTTPHCVAFESQASNLAPGDNDHVSDIFVRDLRRRRTYLVSRGIGRPATNPSIDGACSRVAFTASGRVYVARVRGGRPRALGLGSQPSFARDGSAITWVSGSGAVMLNRAGRTGVVAAHGSSPHVSDHAAGRWGVVFDTTDRLTRRDNNGSQDVYTRTMGPRGGPGRTDLISAARRGAAAFGNSFNGGITSFGTLRGIIVFATGDTLYYRNNASGNIDDLAHSPGGFQDVATSARANFVSFTARSRISRFDRTSFAHVYFKTLRDGQAL